MFALRLSAYGTFKSKRQFNDHCERWFTCEEIGVVCSPIGAHGDQYTLALNLLPPHTFRSTNIRTSQSGTPALVRAFAAKTFGRAGRSSLRQIGRAHV